MLPFGSVISRVLCPGFLGTSPLCVDVWLWAGEGGVPLAFVEPLLGCGGMGPDWALVWLDEVGVVLKDFLDLENEKRKNGKIK